MPTQNKCSIGSTVWRDGATDALGVTKYIPKHNVLTLTKRPRHNARTYADHALINGHVLALNTHNGKYAVRTDILWRGFEHKLQMLSKYHRLCQIRLETPTFFSEAECKKYRRAFQKLRKKLRKHYNTEHIGYLYVRENSSDKGWHFHIVIWVDGKKCNNSHVAWDMWNKLLWDADVLKPFRQDGFPNTLKKIPARMIKANDSSSLSEAVRVWTYLAKTRTKGKGSLNTRDFSISQFSKAA